MHQQAAQTAGSAAVLLLERSASCMISHLRSTCDEIDLQQSSTAVHPSVVAVVLRPSLSSMAAACDAGVCGIEQHVVQSVAPATAAQLLDLCRNAMRHVKLWQRDRLP